MITLEQIQKRITEVIRQSGLTQTELAKQLGIKQPTIGQYLSGRAMPALDTFANLCKVLDVSADYLLCLENEDGTPTTENYSFEYKHGNTVLKHCEKNYTKTKEKDL